MLIFGALLALLSGLFNSVAATLEKRESMLADQRTTGMRLLAVLVRQPLWLVAMGLSAAAWVAEAASLALAPVPVVATLRSSGRGSLVLGGHRWLGESFHPVELLAVALATVGGVITAVGTAASGVSLAPLSLVSQAAVGASAAALTLVVSRWKSGVAQGAAVGVLFAATGVYTKQIGDLFVARGLAAVVPMLASLGPWIMIALSVWAQNLLQGAFRKANAASVAAANASVASLGLVLAGFVLYKESFPGGLDALALVGGVAVALVGTVVLAATATATAPGAATAPDPDPDSGDSPGARRGAEVAAE